MKKKNSEDKSVDPNYSFFCLKGYKNRRPLKHQIKHWTTDNLKAVPYKAQDLILGGLSDWWFAVFAHANFNRIPIVTWAEFGWEQMLVLQSLNTRAPKNGFFNTLALALAHNRERKLTEFRRLKDYAISVDGLPWNKEILRTFLYLLDCYQQIIWRSSNPGEALKSIDLVDFLDLVAKGKAKRLYTETCKQVLVHLLIIQDTRLTARLVKKDENYFNAISEDLLSSSMLQLTSTANSKETGNLLCNLLDNPGDVWLRTLIKKAGIKINLLDSAIDKVQRGAFAGFETKFNGGRSPLYKAQIFTMPLPVDVKKMDEYRLFALFSAYTNPKDQEFKVRALNFETIAAIVGRSVDFKQRKTTSVFDLIGEVIPIFCGAWGYDGKAFSFLMERSSNQKFDYNAVCQKKRSKAVARFVANTPKSFMTVIKGGESPPLMTSREEDSKVTVDRASPSESDGRSRKEDSKVTVDRAPSDGRSRKEDSKVTVDRAQIPTPSPDTKEKSPLGKVYRKEKGKINSRKEEDSQNLKNKFCSLEDVGKHWEEAVMLFKDDFLASEPVDVAHEYYDMFFRIGAQKASKHVVLTAIAKRFVTYCSRVNLT